MSETSELELQGQEALDEIARLTARIAELEKAGEELAELAELGESCCHSQEISLAMGGDTKHDKDCPVTKWQAVRK